MIVLLIADQRRFLHRINIVYVILGCRILDNCPLVYHRGSIAFKIKLRLIGLVSARSRNHPRNPISNHSAMEGKQFQFDDVDSLLRSLEKLEPRDFPSEDRICAICQNSYNIDGSKPESMMRLSCGHHFGNDCIHIWFSPAKTNKNTCPICRTVFFEPSEDVRPETFQSLLQGSDPQFDSAMDEVMEIMRKFERIREMNLASVSGLGAHQPSDQAYFNAPPGEAIILSELVLLLFKAFSRHLAAVSLEEAGRMAMLLGQLRLCLLRPMSQMSVPAVWAFEGPRVHLMTDRDVHGLIRLALERMCEAEEIWYHHESEHLAGRHPQSVS